MEEVQTAPAPDEVESQAGVPVEVAEPTAEEQSAYVNDVLRVRAGFPSTLTGDDDQAAAPSTNGNRPRDEHGRFVKADEAAPAAAEQPPADVTTLRQQIRDEILAEQQATAEHAQQTAFDEDYLGNEQRYQELLAKPDSELSADDYTWREERKERRGQHATVDRHYRTAYEQRLAAATEEVSQKQDAFWNDVRGQLADLSTRPGVDPEEMLTLGSFGAIGQHLYESGMRAQEAAMSSRMQELENENRQLRLTGPNGLTQARAPIAAGRSTAGRPPEDMNERMRRAFGIGV